MIVTFPPLKAMLHGFFDFENYDLDEYEHYEVRLLSFSSSKTKQFCSPSLNYIESRKW